MSFLRSLLHWKAYYTTQKPIIEYLKIERNVPKEHYFILFRRKNAYKISINIKEEDDSAITFIIIMIRVEKKYILESNKTKASNPYDTPVSGWWRRWNKAPSLCGLYQIFHAFGSYYNIHNTPTILPTHVVQSHKY